MLRTYIFTLAYLLSHTLSAQKGLDKLNAYLKNEASTPGLRYANWGLSVVSTQNGKEIVNFNADKLMLPASTLKLITTAAGLEYLGKDFTFKTYFLAAGNVEKGELKGDVIIEGGGDPTLGSKYNGNTPVDSTLLKCIKALKAKGIKTINGNIILDAGHFDKNPFPDGWQWNDIGNYFGAPIYGINYRDNFYSVNFKIQGSKTTITGTEPSDLNLEFINETTAKGNTDLAYIYGAPGQPKRLITGTLPENNSSYSIKGAMPDPALLLGTKFFEMLKKHHIEVRGKVLSSISDHEIVWQCPACKPDTLAIHYSPTLSKIIKQTNHHSLNLFAEAIHRQLGKKVKNTGSTAAGNEVLNDFLAKLNLPKNSYFINDGSGVSPGNSITPSSMAKFLVAMKRKNYQAEFIQSLPIAGKSGTLSSLCKGTKAEGNIMAKSGTLTRVICYSGYVTAKSGDQLAFSLMLNQYGYTFTQMKQVAEKILIMLADIE
jgi:D-alanyl-D-alanine carboxypeptidase/D-alanyl-D-alanine-endopeptidase (penicillin-binding protein 4)